MVPERKQWPDLGARPLFFPAVSAVLGSAVSPACGMGGTAGVGFAVLCAGSAFALRGRPGAHLLVLLSFFSTGLGLGRLHSQTRVPQALSQAGASGVIEAEIEDVSVSSDGQRLRLRVVRFEKEPARFRAQLFSPRPSPGLTKGQRLLLRVALSPYAAASNPGEADLLGLRRRRGLLFKGSFVPASAVVLRPGLRGSRWLEEARRSLSQKAQALAPTPTSAALFATLAAGLRAELSADAERDFARSGLAHLLSVSGVHVAALGWVLLVGLRLLLVRTLRSSWKWDVRRLAAPLCIPWVWAYVAFTGWQPPAVRSAVMASAALVGMAVWRRADLLNALALAAAALVTVDPPSVAELSVQLSFLALLALFAVTPAFRRMIPVPSPDPSTPGVWKYRAQTAREAIVQTLCASAAVTAVSLPVTASAFHQVSLAGLLSNIAVLPCAALLTALCAGGAFPHVLYPPLATPFVFAGTHLCWAVQTVATFFAALPGAVVALPGFSAVPAFAFFVGVATYALGIGRWRGLGLLAPLSLAWVLLSPRWLQPGLSVTFLSVGQGDAIVLSSRGHHALVDGGGVMNGPNPGQTVVLPYLRHRGIGALDLAVLSHPHPDHALGMVPVLEALPVRRLWTAAGVNPGPLTAALEKAAGRPAEPIRTPSPPFVLGEARITVLGPPADVELLEGVNDKSVVLRVEHGEVSFLLTGDIEAAGEEILPLDRPVTVVKAPHHGSRTSSSEPFVARASPQFVVFCVGLRNRFGFPHSNVVERYKSAGSRCFRTDRDGAIRFESDGLSVRWTTFRATEHIHLHPATTCRTTDADPAW